jgi:hypothetical protein
MYLLVNIFLLNFRRSFFVENSTSEAFSLFGGLPGLLETRGDSVSKNFGSLIGAAQQC